MASVNELGGFSSVFVPLTFPKPAPLSFFAWLLLPRLLQLTDDFMIFARLEAGIVAGAKRQAPKGHCPSFGTMFPYQHSRRVFSLAEMKINICAIQKCWISNYLFKIFSQKRIFQTKTNTDVSKPNDLRLSSLPSLAGLDCGLWRGGGHRPKTEKKNEHKTEERPVWGMLLGFL